VRAPHPPLPHLQRTGDGSLTLYSARYAQAYGSRHGALTEALEVFLEPSGVAARLAAGSARVLEVGFGTGLNFFVTARAALRVPGARLHYAALEHDLLTAAELAALGYGALLGEEALVEAFLTWRSGLARKGVQRFSFARPWARKGTEVTLELHHGDAVARVQGLPYGYHAVYQDAFSPEANPELWTPAFLASLAALLVPGGTLTSYCVKGEVRRRLAEVGLVPHKRPGPEGGKREVLLACKPVRAPG
jgi:tRNA U34 5-methylaminomethyl-2-thiouridine-forming methyltransferase MnmC